MRGIRVRPPHKHTHMLLFSGLAGMLCGALLCAVKLYLAVSAVYLPAWAEIVLTITLPFLVTVYWGLLCQHKLPTFFGCLIFASTMIVVVFAIFTYFSPRRESWSEVAVMIGGTVVLGPACGLIGLGVRRICANISRLIVQDGNLCPTCGYDIRGQIEPRCPECGETFDKHLLKQEKPSPNREM